MPPINQQRSTTGLIVALVVFVILFVTSTIFAMSYYNQLKKSVVDFSDYKTNYTTLIPEGSLNSPNVTELKTARSDPRFGITANEPIIDVATKQRDAAEAVIVGTVGTSTPGQVIDQANTALKNAQIVATKLGVTLDPANPNLIAALKAIEDKADSLLTESKAQQDKYSAEAAAHTRDQAVAAAQAEQFEKAVKDLAEKDAATLAAASASGTASQGAVDKTSADLAAQAKQMNDAINKATTDEQAYKRQINSLVLEVQTLKTKLGNRRMDPQNIVTRIDGKIIRAAGKDVCYINIGRGKQISPGLTFEVYDRATGVPPIPPNTSGDDHLPVGKASIEVTSIGEESSECRVVHLEPGAVLAEGDVIANLVYDPNVKFKFFVYGNFDMGQVGRPNAGDADVIRRLITQWGGSLTDRIDVDTDFVVLGAEPQLPTYTREELGEPANVKRLADAQLEVDKYSSFRQTAVDYHIPILNQNRFLYYVGFYDQSKR